MTELTTAWSLPIAGSRSTYLQRRRWRGLNAVLSGAIGTLVVTAAIAFGVTGPATSPVSPAAAAVPNGGAAATGHGLQQADVQQGGTQQSGVQPDRTHQNGPGQRDSIDRHGSRGGGHR